MRQPVIWSAHFPSKVSGAAEAEEMRKRGAGNDILSIRSLAMYAGLQCLFEFQSHALQKRGTAWEGADNSVFEPSPEVAERKVACPWAYRCFQQLQNGHQEKRRCTRLISLIEASWQMVQNIWVNKVRVWWHWIKVWFYWLFTGLEIVIYVERIGTHQLTGPGKMRNWTVMLHISGMVS